MEDFRPEMSISDKVYLTSCALLFISLLYITSK